MTFREDIKEAKRSRFLPPASLNVTDNFSDELLELKAINPCLGFIAVDSEELTHLLRGYIIIKMRDLSVRLVLERKVATPSPSFLPVTITQLFKRCFFAR